MTIGQFLTASTQRLATSGIKSARLDCLILLEDELGSDRAHLLAHLESELTDDNVKSLDTRIAQRVQHEPLAYIRGRSMFYGREFIVNAHVLVPRPETEDMIELLEARLALRTAPNDGPLHIADIGSGSGCLGITAALELPGSHVDLYDIDQRTLDIAAKNARAFGVDARYYNENLLHDAASRHYDVILANLPYVPEHFPINKDATFEPPQALFAGPDGLQLYVIFWQEIVRLGFRPPWVITESLQTQHKTMETLAHQASYDLAQTSTLAQLFMAH
jgi:release factor glutamine methyltransferase